MVMTLMTHDNSPPLPRRAIGNRHDAAIFLWSQNDVLPACGKLFEEAVTALITAVFRPLDAPNNSFHKRWRTPEHCLHLSRFFHGETYCMFYEKIPNFGITESRKRE